MADLHPEFKTSILSDPEDKIPSTDKNTRQEKISDELLVKEVTRGDANSILVSNNRECLIKVLEPEIVKNHHLHKEDEKTATENPLTGKGLSINFATFCL